VPTGASGLSGEETCYWNYGVNCTVSPPSVTGNLLWTLHVVRQSGRYQGNATVDTEVVFPLLDRAIQFYTHFMVSWQSNSVQFVVMRYLLLSLDGCFGIYCMSFSHC
jgi:hypothetical protein